MHPKIMLSQQDYLSHADIKQSYDFYENKFEPELTEHVLYDEMNEAQQADFKKLFEEHYSFLGISDEQLRKNAKNEAKCFQLITQWLLGQKFLSYMTEVENNIVDAHRGFIDRSQVNLDPTLRTSNRQLIKELNQKNEDELGLLKSWGQSDYFPKL